VTLPTQPLAAAGASASRSAEPRLWLLRHASPLIEPGICYGALDLAADLDATREAAHTVASQLPQAILVVTSPLQRCELLAQTLCGLRPDFAYKTEPRLREMNFGCFEGQRWESISQQAYDDWVADFWAHRFGGVDCVADLLTRVAGAWDEARRSGQPQIWITHAGVIRAATLLSKGIRRVNDAAQWPVAAPAFGQCCVLRLADRPGV